MRVLYLHQFFMTREGTGGTRSYEFARRLVAAGDEVTMVTSGTGGERRVDGIRVVEARGGYGDYVRATKVGYGRRLLAALPPMRRLQDPQDFEQALADLAGAVP